MSHTSCIPWHTSLHTSPPNEPSNKHTNKNTVEMVPYRIVLTFGSVEKLPRRQFNANRICTLFSHRYTTAIICTRPRDFFWRYKHNGRQPTVLNCNIHHSTAPLSSLHERSINTPSTRSIHAYQNKETERCFFRLDLLWVGLWCKLVKPPLKSLKKKTEKCRDSKKRICRNGIRLPALLELRGEGQN